MHGKRKFRLYSTFIYVFIHSFIIHLCSPAASFSSNIKKKVSIGTLILTDSVIGLHVQTLILETNQAFYTPFSWEFQTIARMVLYTA